MGSLLGMALSDGRRIGGCRPSQNRLIDMFRCSFISYTAISSETANSSETNMELSTAPIIEATFYKSYSEDC